MASRPATLRHRPVALLSALAVALALSACRNPPVPTGALGTDGPVASVFPASPAGSTASAAASVEESELPAGFPVPPGAVAEAVGAEPGQITRWSLNDHGSVAYEFFLAELPRARFPIDDALPGGAAAIIRFSTPDGDELQIDLVGTNPVRIDLVVPHD